MKTYLVQKNRHGKIKFLIFTLKDNELTREWGQIGGISQGFHYEYKAINVGKANELTPEQAAKADYDRIIKIKIKEGYIVTDSLKELPNLPEHTEKIDLDNIPTSFCCSKPIQKIGPRVLNKLIKSGNAQFFVKYNGGCHYILIDSLGDIKIFTRRWDDHTLKYPSIINAVVKLHLPPKTLLITEFCIDPLLALDHMTAQKYMAEISKANTVKGKCKVNQEKALKKQEKYPVKAAVFGVLYYDGLQTWHFPYAKIWAKIAKSIPALNEGQGLFAPQEALIKSAKEAFALAKAYKAKIEGFVVWDTSASMEVTMTGKPLRRASWKIKAKGEMDVIAIGGEYGKKEGLYGSLKIARYDQTGKLIPMGSVGGLKHKKGEADPSFWNFPCVIEVTYDNIFPDTGFLQFGSFSKIHEDKTIEEVGLFSLVS